MYSRQKKLFIFVTAMVALVLILFSVAVFKTFQATNLLKNAQFYKASESAKAAQTVVSLFEKATFNSVQTISAWKSGLQIIQDTNQLHQAVTTQSARIAGSDANFSIAELNKPVQNLRISVTEFGNATKNAWLLQKILNSNQKKLLTDTSALLTQSATAIDLLSQENQRWIVLFQNNQEIRATGGFMGSYAIISLQDGVVSEIIIEDIYDADGQFTGFLSAPPGLEKYLSGGRGVRLPNANWSVDFPTASQEILQLFALSGRADVDGIIAISLPLIEDLVNIVGPLNTPDFTDPVTGETLSEILRSDREDFFPGST
ncbi:MAG: DUF4012 domain-containing protein, partial [Microgenomates group bacterium]